MTVICLTCSRSLARRPGADCPDRFERRVVRERAVAGRNPLSIFRERHSRRPQQRNDPFGLRMGGLDQHDSADQSRIPRRHHPRQIPRPAPHPVPACPSIHPSPHFSAHTTVCMYSSLASELESFQLTSPTCTTDRRRIIRRWMQSKFDRRNWLSPNFDDLSDVSPRLTTYHSGAHCHTISRTIPSPSSEGST